jgi:hypothetical protein
MERHDRFEELLAEASVGEANGERLVELELHIRDCPSCRQAYADFVELCSIRMLAEANEQSAVTGPEAMGYIDSMQFRERFLRKAEAEGIIGSGRKPESTIPSPTIVQAVRSNRLSVYATRGVGVAAAVLVCLGGFAIYRAKQSAGTRSQGRVDTGSSGDIVQRVPREPSLEESRSLLENDNRKLSSEIAALRASLAKESSAAEEWKTTVASAERVHASDSKKHEATISALEQQLNQAQAQVMSVREELEEVQTANQTTIASDQIKIRELSSQLAEQSSTIDRDREMLTANRDIRDLMSARNLHIADVFDTDGRGNTRTAFGRVFFTDGKSLIIYAYDLNDRRVEEAGYHYRVWGKKEGPAQGVKSLGIFYSDDKAQKRWVFKYADPKVLSEIDSVFVTLEPPGKNLTEPKGEKFLYAYLRNQPNHP